jgi:hypothetical protein
MSVPVLLDATLKIFSSVISRKSQKKRKNINWGGFSTVIT